MLTIWVCRRCLCYSVIPPLALFHLVGPHWLGLQYASLPRASTHASAALQYKCPHQLWCGLIKPGKRARVAREALVPVVARLLPISGMRARSGRWENAPRMAAAATVAPFNLSSRRMRHNAAKAHIYVRSRWAEFARRCACAVGRFGGTITTSWARSRPAFDWCHGVCTYISLCMIALHLCLDM